MNLNKFIPTFLFSFLSLEYVEAHCPLCTFGAIAIAGGAAWLGISNGVIGLFIGAFAVSMGLWISNLVKKEYIPFQRALFVLSSYLLTVLPLLTIVGNSAYPFYISLSGDYGTWLNKTYLINLFLVTSILGGLIVFISPWLSKTISKLRGNRTFPFQGMILTFILLLLIGGIIQFGVL